MIELKNISKSYKPKKGLEVKALDNINLQLNENGMIFLLGKSGSGKSTLLNIMGGLDLADQGEVIIYGKSSKEFNGSDFDSYRNTYMGFIFQEYNLLDDFTVRENIALALELQGQDFGNEEIDKILAQVDLEGIGERRPRELSGGQKQRVAIARALIKSPRVLMADEPTGALDSNTGKQVFDTLKNLSKDRLVIVVSHDREFAEKYADRIIELSDGKIISDKNKFEKDDAVDNNKSKINSKITSPFHLIKSKLPLKNSIKMGASSLKTKKIRLIVTILLSTIAFILFGLSSTMAAYSQSKSMYHSMLDYNINYLSFSKQKSVKIGSDHTYYSNSLLNEEDVSKISKKFPSIGFTPVFSNDSYGNGYSFRNNLVDLDKSTSKYEGYSLYTENIYGFASIDENVIKNNDFKLIGSLPKNDDEIVITNYIYEQFKLAGYTDGQTECAITTPNDMIDKTIMVNENLYVISGILDTNFDISRYETFLPSEEKFKGSKDIPFNIDLLSSEMETVISKSFHAVGYISKPALDKLIEKNKGYSTYDNNEFGTRFNLNKNSTAITDLISKDLINPKYCLYLENNKNTLSNNEVLIPLSALSNIVIKTTTGEKNLSDIINDKFYSLLNEYAQSYVNTAVEKGYVPSNSDSPTESYILYLQDDGYKKNSFGENGYQLYINLTKQACSETLSQYKAEISKSKLEMVIEEYYNDFKEQKTGLKIVGVYLEPKNGSFSNLFEFTKKLALNHNIINKYNFQENASYGFLLSAIPNNKEMIKNVIDYSFNTYEQDNKYLLNNSTSYLLNRINHFIEDAANAFVYIGLVFALFSSIMLFNFISTSITNKKRDIGILRALGARSKDVFSIFLSESFIIALISWLTSIILTTVIITITNLYLQNKIGLPFTLLNFGPIQIGCILLISLLTAFLASLIPVYQIAKKRPIDAIRK